jgi:putative tricarboxylic transport membrane protein
MDLSIGLLSIVFAVWFLVGSLQLPGPLNKVNIGPGAFPLIISILIIIVATMIIVTTLLKKEKDHKNQYVTIVRFKNIAASIGIIILYTFSIPYLGFYLATAIYFPVMLYLASESNWKTIIFVTVVFELFSFVIFEKILGVLLP